MSCGPRRPDGEACLIDIADNSCARLKVPEDENGSWKYLGDRPLSEINTYFAFSPEYIVELRQYITELRDRYEDKCR